jgi:hypothetical protein
MTPGIPSGLVKRCLPSPANDLARHIDGKRLRIIIVSVAAASSLALLTR